MSEPPPPTTPPAVEDAALRKADPETIKMIERIIKTTSAKAAPTPAATPPPTTESDADKIELEKYREADRQTILKETPKEVIEEFKLAEKPLAEVQRVHRLYKAIQKKDVGVTPPPPSETTDEKTLRWNPNTGKNEVW